MTTSVTSPVFDLHGPAPDARDLEAFRAWFKAEPQRRLSQNPRRQHVQHVCQLLLEGARERAYDGLVIIAAEPIVADVEAALSPEVRALLIGNIVRDASIDDRGAIC